MNKELIKNIRLGLFVITGTALLILALYFIGSNSNLFSKTFKLYARFETVNGLKKGNNVRYAGIDVGTIKNIEIVNDTTIRVEMSVEADLKKVIAHFEAIRDEKQVRLRKKPATAELLQWAFLLKKIGFPAGKLGNLDALSDAERSQLLLSYSVLAKSKEDIKVLEDWL